MRRSRFDRWRLFRRLGLAFVAAVGFVAFVGTSARAQESAPKFLLEWGKKGEGPGEFYSPIGIAFDSHGDLFVTDLNNARVQKFSADGQHLEGFDLPRDTADRKSTMIGGIAIDGDDLIYVTYMIQHKVVVYRESGELVREWGKLGAAEGEFNQPGGILLGDDGTVTVCDQCNHRVQTFSKEGRFLSQWGGYGTDEGQFDGLGTKGTRFGGPHFIARDRGGRLFTTEGFQGRVQAFSPEGKRLTQWGDKGDQPGGFGAYDFGSLPTSVVPIGIAIDSHDRVFVSSLNDRVQCFDTTGKFLFGIEGTGKEGDTLLHPHGMAFDREGRLYICDAGNQRILKFEIPAPAEEK